MFKKWMQEARQSDEYWIANTEYGFTEEIYKLMKEQNVTKAELARRMNIKPYYITKILQGNTDFSFEFMVKLARRLGRNLEIKFVLKENFSKK